MRLIDLGVLSWLLFRLILRLATKVSFVLTHIT